MCIRWSFHLGDATGVTVSNQNYSSSSETRVNAEIKKNAENCTYLNQFDVANLLVSVQEYGKSSFKFTTRLRIRQFQTNA
jgi:hypothetical protein